MRGIRLCVTLLAWPAIAAAQGAPPAPPAPETPPPTDPTAPPAPSSTPETPPPAAQPPAAPPPGAHPQQPYPPYPYPYPYPPPGYAGYPPPGYYGYPPPAPQAPARPPKPRYPDDAAAQSSPFFDITVGGVNLDNRIQHFLLFGAQVGVYIGGLVRVAPMISLFASEAEDDLSADQFESVPTGFSPEPSATPTILWGGSVGFAVVSRQNFVLSPGVLFASTDVGAYGSFIGLNAPFEWVTDDGARVGFSVAVGRAFAGSVRATCFGGGSPPVCDTGEKRDFDRQAGAGFYAQFEIGWGLNHPDPLPREP